MSIQIRISYETDEELLSITERLEGLDLRLEIASQNGRYKRAYLKQNPFRERLTRFNNIPSMTTKDHFPIK